jgi:hypothetical protein
MDAKIKADWIKALRSGEYEQGMGKLQVDGKFCCLGVLCELAPNVHRVSTTVSGIVVYGSGTSDNREENYPPTAAWLWAGWVEKDPFVETGFSQAPDGSALASSDTYGNPRRGCYLSNLNDAGFTFDQIADVIAYFL